MSKSSELKEKLTKLEGLTGILQRNTMAYNEQGFREQVSAILVVELEILQLLGAQESEGE